MKLTKIIKKINYDNQTWESCGLCDALPWHVPIRSILYCRPININAEPVKVKTQLANL